MKIDPMLIVYIGLSIVALIVIVLILTSGKKPPLGHL